MNTLNSTCAMLSAALLVIVNSGDVAAQSYWNLGAAPAELASYGYTNGSMFLDDDTATYHVAEFVPHAGHKPPEVAIVALHKGDARAAFVAFEPAQATDGSGASVTGRRVAAAETERFNRVVFPALARAYPRLAHAIRLHHFVYAKGRHFQPTRGYREWQESTKTGHEQTLLDLLWLRDIPSQPFAPHPRLMQGVPAEGLPATIAEATRERAPLEISARGGSAPSVAVPPMAKPAVSARRERTAGTASRGIDLYVDLSHYSRENLHEEAVAGSRNNGIVVVAFTGEEEARDMHRIVADHVRAGALIRSVMRAAPEAGMRFDIYYNGISLFRSKRSSRPPAGSLDAELKPIVELQSIDIRMAEKQKEIDELERKIEAMDRAFELGDDPDINK